MKKDRLHSILQLAEVSEDSAAKEYAEAKEVWTFNQARLEELRAFRDDYRTSSSAAGMTATRFQSTRQFLNQLSEAIDQQEVQVEVMLDKMEGEEVVWHDHRVKRKSIEKLVENRVGEAEAITRKREQNVLDEMALRRRNPSDNP